MCRDLKPENFLLSTKEDNAPLKATDFGLSVFYSPGQIFKDVVGSAYYVAPEVPSPSSQLPLMCYHSWRMYGYFPCLLLRLCPLKCFVNVGIPKCSLRISSKYAGNRCQSYLRKAVALCHLAVHAS